MKLLIASDIHGSAKHAEQLLKAYGYEKPDRIVLLGDLLYHGPRNSLPDDYDTRRTMEILNSLRSQILAVRGNCDSEVDQMVLDFPIMNRYELFEADGLKIFATHGHSYDPMSPPPFVEMDIMLNGHTHVPSIKRYDGFVYVNPGSVSIPKGGSAHSYAVLEDRRISLRRLDSREEYDSLQL